MILKKIKFLLPVLLLMVLLPPPAQAQMFSEKRQESHAFKLKSGAIVQVINKYGNVTIVPWEKDSVRFEVSIAAQSKQVAKARKIISSIDCELISTAGFVSARTLFRDNNSAFWKEVVTYAGQVINSSNNLQINYTVYMPVGNPVKIENKFGNVYMDSHRGNTDITLSNGDMQARDFTGFLKLGIEFGTVNIQDAERIQADINYSDFNAQHVRSITLTSRSSTYDFEQADLLELTSSRDKFTIRSCSSLSGETSFSRLRINQFDGSASLVTRYGEIRFSSIAREFKTIYLRSEYTDLYMGLQPAAACSADLIYDAKTSLNIQPALFSQMKKETLDPKTGSMKASGDLGRNGTSQITVTLKSGSISLLNK